MSYICYTLYCNRTPRKHNTTPPIRSCDPVQSTSQGVAVSNQDDVQLLGNSDIVDTELLQSVINDTQLPQQLADSINAALQRSVIQSVPTIYGIVVRWASSMISVMFTVNPPLLVCLIRKFWRCLDNLSSKIFTQFSLLLPPYGHMHTRGKAIVLYICWHENHHFGKSMCY